MKTITEDNADRLALGMMVQRQSGYEDARRYLSSLKLNVRIGASALANLPDQAAVLTAINAGVRAFHGGVTVELEKDGDCLLPFGAGTSFSTQIMRWGGVVIPLDSAEGLTVCFEAAPRSVSDLIVRHSDWRGGVFPQDTAHVWESGPFKLAAIGVAAGALAVHQAFCVSTGLSTDAGRLPFGIDLWESSRAEWWKAVSYRYPAPIPPDLWMLGLGHLGQGFLWNLLCLEVGLAPRGKIVLQDYDHVIEANQGSSLLCQASDIGKLKNEVCADYLRTLGYDVDSRRDKFGNESRRQKTEPNIAVAGFHDGESRRYLTRAGFDFVLEAGIGDSIEDFDSIGLHTLPQSSLDPFERWRPKPAPRAPHPVANLLLKENPAGCGTVFETIAAKSVSSSFVGAFVGACHMAELMRRSVLGPRVLSAEINLRGLYGAPTNLMVGSWP